MLRGMIGAIRATLVGAATLWLSACSAAVPAAIDSALVPEQFSAAGSAPVPERWWQAFDDADLSGLVELALAENFSLRAAWDRLRQAEAIARREGAPLVPTVDFEASTTRTELTQSAAAGAGVRGRNDFRLGLAASYELDIWGRVRAGRDAARLDALASAADLHAAAMSIAAEVARAWFDLVEQRTQLDLVDAQVATNEQLLELVTLRFRSGQAGAADVLRQRQLLAATRGERFLLEAQHAVLEHRLAVLSGRPAGSLALPARRTLPSLPAEPDLGVPADVVVRRPDVRSAYQAILAADRRLAGAQADRYPRLSLTGASAFTAREVRDVFDNWLATFTAALVAPLIDGRRRSSEADRSRAVVGERAGTYAQTVLDALREVEDALARERAQRARLANLEEQIEFSGAALVRLREQYLYGGTRYLDVLEAVNSFQSLQRARETAARDLFEHRIELYRAAGGDFPLRESQPTTFARAGGTQ